VKYVKARELKARDRARLSGFWRDVQGVTVGVSRVAIQIGSGEEETFIETEAHNEILIKDREPASALDVPAPAKWSIRYQHHQGLVSAKLTRGLILYRIGPWCYSEAEAMEALLKAWGQEIEERGQASR
jgi:hypothetical protein